MRPPIRIVLTGILVFLSAGVSAHAQSISSQPRQTEIATPPAVALPTARAQEAVRALKHKKLYDSLAAAYQAARYRVECNEHPAVPGQSAWHADNPAQEMGVDFAADAVHITASESDGAAATVVLRLTGYGYSSNQQPPARAVLRADENRITYDRGVLREWYINDRGGLEQGFTLTQPPAVPTGGPLVLTIAIDTGLQTRLAADSGRIQFVDSMDRVQFQYADLKAWDAAGRKLPAKMLASNGRIALLINDSGATYPVTIDPLIFTEPKLTASDAATFDEFGNSVGISGATAVIGAPGKSGVTGAAYVFVRSGSVWSQQQKLTASDPAVNDGFGFSVGISADTAVIGAFNKSSATGAAYVFVRSGSVWSQQPKLTASDASAGDRFGDSVGISGDTAVIGAPFKSGFAGAAYVFEGVLIVSIDIKPGEDPPSINRRSHGKTPVALLSSPTFDATSADRSTVVFAGASPLNIGLDFVDVNGDGLLDVVFHFSTQSLNLPDGTTQACMTGRTIDGQDFKGCDSLRLVR